MNHGSLKITADPALSSVEFPQLDYAFIIGDLCGQLGTTGTASLDTALANLAKVKRQALFVEKVRVLP